MKHTHARLHLCFLYVFVFSFLFILQKYTIGYIPGLRNIIIFDNLYFYKLLFAINAILIIKYFIKIELPSRYPRTLKEQ